MSTISTCQYFVIPHQETVPTLFLQVEVPTDALLTKYCSPTSGKRVTLATMLRGRNAFEKEDRASKSQSESSGSDFYRPLE